MYTKKHENNPIFVVKIGSSLVTKDGKGLDHTAIMQWSRQIAEIQTLGNCVILLSSGAIAEGKQALNYNREMKQPQRQAAATLGQTRVTKAWEDALQNHGVSSAQILIKQEDIIDKKRYVHARNLINELLKNGVVPVINENITLNPNEPIIDNDTFGGLISNLIEANHSLILTDQKGFYTDDPRKNPQAKLIEKASAYDPSLISMAGDSASDIGKGGMQTKLLSAQLAGLQGTTTHIASGHEPNILTRLVNGELVGTALTGFPTEESRNSLKFDKHITSYLISSGQLSRKYLENKQDDTNYVETFNREPIRKGLHPARWQ